MQKICQRCKRSLPLTMFVKNIRQKDGLNTWCKDCANEYRKKYYESNRERLLEKDRERYKKDPEKKRAYARKRREENREILNAKALEYQRNNREKVYERQNAWAKRQRAENPSFAIRHEIRRSMNRFIKGIQRGGKILKHIGCSLDEYKSYMESLFVEGMTWESYGKTWTVDHITPLTSFDLLDEEQLAKAVNFKNTQPLTLSDNVRKGGKK